MKALIVSLFFLAAQVPSALHADENWFALGGELTGLHVDQAKLRSLGLKVIGAKMGEAKDANNNVPQGTLRSLILYLAPINDIRYEKLSWMTLDYPTAIFQKVEFETRVTVMREIVGWGDASVWSNNMFEVLRPGTSTRIYIAWDAERQQQFKEQGPTILTFGK